MALIFDVNERGKIKNIKIQGSNTDMAKKNVGAIAVKLDQSTYRLKIDEGR